MNMRPTFDLVRYPAADRRPMQQPPLPSRRLKSSDLFGSLTEIGIEHEGSVYRLKITRQRKLILNK